MLLSNTALKFLSVASVTTQLTTAATTKNIIFCSSTDKYVQIHHCKVFKKKAATA